MASVRNASRPLPTSPSSAPLPRSATRRASTDSRGSALRKSCWWSEPSLPFGSCDRRDRVRRSGRSIGNTRSACHSAYALRPFGSDKLVDAGRKILQHKILVGRGFAVVDLLRPLLKRQLDAKSLVDGESDVEEVQAVDPEIVNGVAFRFD